MNGRGCLCDSESWLKLHKFVVFKHRNVGIYKKETGSLACLLAQGYDVYDKAMEERHQYQMKRVQDYVNQTLEGRMR